MNKEEQKILKQFNFKRFPSKNSDDAFCISEYQKLSESFIGKHKDWLAAFCISQYQKLSESFIEKHKDWLAASRISGYQKLSESFIGKHKDWLNASRISGYQKLSESFIEKHKDWLDAFYISAYQKLSESFIGKHKDWLAAFCISQYQKLSESFIEKHKDWLDASRISAYQKYHHRTRQEKIKEMKEYANKWNLEFKDKYLYAYREHDRNGCGIFNKTIVYVKGYYRDWHCDIIPINNTSFGLGIWPKGNTKVKISIKDWGTIVQNDSNGKARVWGFTIL